MNKRYTMRPMAQNLEDLNVNSQYPVNVAGTGDVVFRPSFLVKVAEPYNRSQSYVTNLEMRAWGHEALLDNLDDIFTAQKRAQSKFGNIHTTVALKDLYVDFMTAEQLLKCPTSPYNYPKYHGFKVMITPVMIVPVNYSVQDFEDFKKLLEMKVGDTPFDPYDEGMMSVLLNDSTGVVTDRIKTLANSILALAGQLGTQRFTDDNVSYRVSEREELLEFLTNILNYHQSGPIKEKDIFRTYTFSEVKPNVQYERSKLAYIKIYLAGDYNEQGSTKTEVINQECWDGLVAHYRQLSDKLAEIYSANPVQGQFYRDSVNLERLLVAEYPTRSEMNENIVNFSDNSYEYNSLNWFYIMREDFSLSLVPSRVRYDIGRRFDVLVNPLPEGSSFTRINDPTNRYCDDLFLNYVDCCARIYRNILLPKELKTEGSQSNVNRVVDFDRTTGRLFSDVNDYFYGNWMCSIVRSPAQNDYYQTNKSRMLFFNKELVIDYLMGYIPLFTVKVGTNANLMTDMFNSYKMMIKNWILPVSLELLKTNAMRESIQKVVSLESPIYLPQKDIGSEDMSVMARMTKGKADDGESTEASMPGNAAATHFSVNFLVALAALGVPLPDLNASKFVRKLIEIAEGV